MTKQEFLGISSNYELMFKDTFRNSIHLLTGLKTDKNDSIYEGGVYSHGLYMSWKNCTPILYSIDMLTKPIEYKGKKFIPIIELSKIIKSKLTIVDEYIVDESLAPNCARCQDHYFWFNGDSFLYSILTDKREHKLTIENQQEMLFKLIEWHFAVNLDESEYINVNTLDVNPYK